MEKRAKKLLFTVGNWCFSIIQGEIHQHKSKEITEQIKQRGKWMRRVQADEDFFASIACEIQLIRMFWMRGPEGTFYEYRKFATQALKYDQNLILCAVNNITRSTVPALFTSLPMCHKSKENYFLPSSSGGVKLVQPWVVTAGLPIIQHTVWLVIIWVIWSLKGKTGAANLHKAFLLLTHM